MRTVVAASLRFQYLVVILAGVVILVGIGQVRRMPVDVLPEFSPPYVEIQTEALGLSAEEVEQMITVPMEQDLLAGVAWLDVIRSESVPGLSSVLVYFEPGTDLYRARQMVAERIAQSAVGLPHVSKPPTMIQPLSSSSRFMIVGLSSQELSLIQMSVLARWTIAPRLMGVPGVAHVAIWGQRDRQLQVLVDPARLQAQGVSLQQVVETAGNALWVSSLTFLEASSPGAGGFIDTPNQRLGLWHVLPISSPEELAQVPVEGTHLALGDVANVVEDHQPLIGDAVINQSPNLLLVIEKLPGINTLEVTRGIDEALDALRPGFSAIQFDATLFRSASFIEKASANLSRSLVVGAGLVFLALVALLRGWRTALISLVAIPLSLVAALLVLYLRGSTINVMVLAGLLVVLGLVIDDAVVDVEHIARRLNERRSPTSATSVVLEASAEMRGTLFFATLICLIALLPVFFMEGVPGTLLQPLAASYVLAVLAAMAVALTVTPALSGTLLCNPRLEHRESLLLTRLQRGYERSLGRIVQRPGFAYAAVAALVVPAIAVVPLLAQRPLVPVFQEPYLTIQLQAAPGTSLPEMNRIVGRVSQELRSLMGVQNVGSHVGRAVFGDRVVGINFAELWVSVDPQADYGATIATIEETVAGYPGLDRKVQTYVRQTLRQPQSTAQDAITVRLFGEDHLVLQDEVERVREAVAGIPGVANARAVLPQQEPTLEIQVDLSVAQRYGVKPGDVRRAAATLLSGIQVGSLFEQQKVFDVVVWGVPEARSNLTAVRDLLIETPGGGSIRLGDVAAVRIASSPTVIRREAVSPYLDVVFNVEGRGARAVVREVQDALRSMTFPLEYHAEVQGDFAARQAALQRVLVAAGIAVVGIFMLLQASFGSWRLAAVAILTFPMALAGSALAAFLGGPAFSLSALFGSLTVLGLAVRNGVLMTSHMQDLQREGAEAFGPALVLRGARERLGPIAITTLVATLALLPFAVSAGLPGHEMLGPMAVVMLGGLLASTLLDLYLLPTLYLRFGAAREPELEFRPVTAAAD